MTLKKLLIDGHIFDRDDAASGLVFDDVVDEKRWVSEGKAIERAGDGGHGPIQDSSKFKVQSSKFSFEVLEVEKLKARNNSTKNFNNSTLNFEL